MAQTSPGATAATALSAEENVAEASAAVVPLNAMPLPEKVSPTAYSRAPSSAALRSRVPGGVVARIKRHRPVAASSSSYTRSPTT